VKSGKSLANIYGFHEFSSFPPLLVLTNNGGFNLLHWLFRKVTATTN